MSAASLTGVTAWFGSLAVLQNVSLDFRKDEVSALIGPSGGGKSTVLRLLNRMVDEAEDFRFEGSVTLSGHDLFAAGVEAAAVRRRVGTIFSSPVPFPGTVFDNVAFGPRLAGMRSESALVERVESALVEAGLQDELEGMLQAEATTLPPGQAQRLCIARALALDPEILVMDEPTGALDPIATGQVEAFIRSQRGERAVILATRDTQLAARVADRTAFLDRGRVVEFTTTEELFTRPQNTATEAFLSRRYN